MTFDPATPHPSDRLTLAELDMNHRLMAYRAVTGWMAGRAMTV
jgi:hypothetical protein